MSRKHIFKHFGVIAAFLIDQIDPAGNRTHIERRSDRRIAGTEDDISGVDYWFEIADRRATAMAGA